ncbi:hypothetical protein KKA14_05475 [bacterium]|nr:hypothetical protein [bacterium]
MTTDTRESGFIDLVLVNHLENYNLVVECKRVKDTSWIFLVEGTGKIYRRDAKCFVLDTETVVNRFEWFDLPLDPKTFQSQYCVIPGTDNRSISLIERAAAELVSSTEGLATEDRALSKSVCFGGSGTSRIYFNVIVTTASLQVCHLDPGKISLENGTVDEAILKEVPFLRFRKQLNPSYELSKIIDTSNDKDVIRAKENTIFVVNSKHITKFLNEFRVDSLNLAKRFVR